MHAAHVRLGWLESEALATAQYNNGVLAIVKPEISIIYCCCGDAAPREGIYVEPRRAKEGQLST
jgi:hypothetical protein